MLRHLPALIRDYGSFIGLSLIQTRCRYPVRTFRYLVPLTIMRRFAVLSGRPLGVAEIGIGTGQMKRFADSMSRVGATDHPLYAKWVGLTKTVREDHVAEAGYDTLATFDADADAMPDLTGINCVLLLHVLEHLDDPEQFLRRLIASLPIGSLIIGGVPSSPGIWRKIRERQLLRKYQPGGHSRAFSVRSLRRLSERLGVDQRLVTGNFLLRWSGSWLEDCYGYAWANLALSRLIPGCSGEVTFVWIKRSDPAAPPLQGVSKKPPQIPPK